MTLQLKHVQTVITQSFQNISKTFQHTVAKNRLQDHHEKTFLIAAQEVAGLLLAGTGSAAKAFNIRTPYQLIKAWEA